MATLNGSYHFVATKYLYTAGTPHGLTQDFITFLASDAMATRLRDLDYIGCSQLSGSKISGSCQ